MNIYLQGLMISLIGLLTTFMVLGVFILIMIVLQKLFPVKPEVQEAGEVEEIASAAVVTTDAATGDDQAVIAAIAAALAYFRNQSNLGNTLYEGRGNWWITRRGLSNQTNITKR